MAIDKNKIIEAATKYVQKGQYDKAIKEYNKLLEADPRDARIQQKLGELYQKKGENNLAADCFLKVAESYSADGFFLKAVAVYKQVLKLNPSLISVNIKLAELHQQLGLMSDAMAQYQLVANHYDKVGDIRSSLDVLRKMVELDPDNIASRIKLAELYAREQMNGEAVAEFRHCAEYLKRNNRIDDYVKVAERLVFLDPSDLELTRELAGIYLAKQDTKRALAKLQLCFKADPKDVETLSMLAQAFKDLGQLSKTISVYKELAKIYDEQDRVDAERDVWRKVLELAPDDPDARARMAPKQAAAPAPVERAAPAAPAYAAPVSTARSSSASASAPAAPVSPEQINKLLTETDVYVKYGLHDKAFEHLKKVFAADPRSIDAHEKAVHLHTVTNDGAAQLDYLVRTIRLCIEKGELDRARPHLQRLCEKDPMHAEVQGFLEAVGGLAPVEEAAEIEEEAILVDAADEVVEVAEEPENALPESQDFTVEPLAHDEPMVADDEVLAVAADSSDDELIADGGGGEDF
ncbi:MAG: tetratricopeptide repeat protein, partial [Myxococcales bacterium]